MTSSSLARCIAGSALAAILAAAPVKLAAQASSPPQLGGVSASGSYLAARHAAREEVDQFRRDLLEAGRRATSASVIPWIAVAPAGIGHEGRTSRANLRVSRPSASSRSTASETISSRSGAVPVVSQSKTAYAAGAGTSLRLCTGPGRL